MAVTGIRQWLKDQGYAKNDNEITYDNGNVKLNGRSFINATPSADNTTYADTNDLTKAWNNYRTNQLQNQSGSLLNTAAQRVQQPVQTYQYNRQTLESDPQYQAALSAAKKNARTAANNAMVSLGSRGIGNSSAATDRAAQIQQSAVSNVETQLVPQLMAQAYQRWQDQQNASRQQTNDILGLASAYNNYSQQAVDNAYRDKLFDQNTLESNRNYGLNKSAQEAQLTGLYNPYSDQISKMQANSQAWFKSSPEEQQRLAAENNTIAAQIGANKDANGDWVYPTGQQTVAENQRQVQNDQWNKQFDYKKQQDALNRQDAAQEFGLKQALQAAQIGNMSADNARQNASLGMQSSNQNLNNLYKIWEYTGQAPEGIPGVAAGTPLSSRSGSSGQSSLTSKISQYRQMYTAKDPQTGSLTVTDPVSLRKAIIANAGSEDEIDQLLQFFGIADTPKVNSGGR